MDRFLCSLPTPKFRELPAPNTSLSFVTRQCLRLCVMVRCNAYFFALRVKELLLSGEAQDGRVSGSKVGGPSVILRSPCLL